ncbi:GNAT family N-acetyltransferase [Bacillus massiliigorillae]|uniref:GNAT family N-acetyltransferase n=1 Tax=Bacillus massiliigorillae TaxID=1243664 RepID=UPI0003A9E897|nr:GNAT family N-acetyltransferase [Bacillus massiliigorillae]
MTEQYRIATLADAEVVLDLTHRAYEPIRELGLPFPAATATLEMMKENINKHATYVAEVDENVIATITLIYPWGHWREDAEYPYVWWFAVDPAYKKQGVGNRLLTYIEETIVRDTLKAPELTLATSIHHPWLIPMYERRGYEKVELLELEHDTVYVLRKVVNAAFYQESNKEESIK